MSNNKSVAEMISIIEALERQAQHEKERREAAEERREAAEKQTRHERERRELAEKLMHHEKEQREAAEKRASDAELSPERGIIKRDLEKLRDALDEDTELYYEPQKDVARKIVSNINNQHIVLTLVLAPCQAGKTGCITATIEALLMSNSEIDMNNIIVLTGLSDNEWRDQTRSRLPIPDENIFHRGQLRNMEHKLENLKNAVIFIDECQIATESGSNMNRIFGQCRLKDVEYLKEKNINVVELSATPNKTLDDLELWNTFGSKPIIMDLSKTKYKGHKHMLENNMVYEAGDLYIDEPISEFKCETHDQYKAIEERIKKIQPAIDRIKNLKDIIEENFIKEDGKPDPKYHIFRTPSAYKGKDKTVEDRFKKIFGSSNYEFINCNSNDGNLLKQINKETPPSKHMIIFIKESARCAVTFTKKHNIGIVYERFTKHCQDDITAQGLAARVGCGYDVNVNCIIYANIRGIQAYVDMIESGFVERSDFKYTGKKSKKKTLNHPSTFTNVSSEVLVNHEEVSEPHIEKCNTQDEAKEYYNKELKVKHNGRGPNKRTPDSNGMYLSTIGKGDNRTRVRTTEEIYAVRKWNLNSTHDYTYHPCYENINDKSTLQWWLIHY